MSCVLGLTGGIGCGKSKVLYIFGKLGAKIISCDHLAHEIMQTPEVSEKVAKEFGSNVLDEEGKINRRKLGNIVFKDVEKRAILNSIIHPLINEALEKQLMEYRGEKTNIPLVVEVPLLFELKMHLSSLFDVTMCIAADDDIRIPRIMERDNITQEQAQDRIASQMSLSDKIELAAIIIFNNGSYDDLWDQIEPLYERLVANEK